MPEEKGLVGVEEAADFLGVDRRTIHNMIRLGQIPAVKFAKRWFVPWRELVEARKPKFWTDTGQARVS